MQNERVLIRIGTKLLRAKKTENQKNQTLIQPVAQPAGTSKHMLQLQRQYGNRFVLRMVDLSRRSGDNNGIASNKSLERKLALQQATDVLTLQRETEGKTGTEATAGIPTMDAAQPANLTAGEANEWGEQDGYLTSDVVPHIFVNGGKTGSALDNTVGGRGGSGDQSVAAINLVAPHYESRAPVGPGAQAKAWIRPGTGTATVTRSYTGSLIGANGPTLYMTARAVARTDAHEVLHVNSSKAIHDRYIVPLEARLARYTGESNALSSGTTAVAAQTALQNVINWNTTIDAFRRDDTAANTPMGTVDVADLASPTFLRDYGPRSVNGVNYLHYFDVPPGPRPGPTAPP